MSFINEKHINKIISSASHIGSAEISSVLKKARELKGLSIEEAAVLISAKRPEELEEIFKAAAFVKEKIYGERLVLFAPLYVSDYCVNDCAYCNFHLTNEKHERRALSMQEVEREAKCLIEMGHKRVLMEFGEDPISSPINYVCGAIRAVYAAESKGLKIRRVNVNIAATTEDNYRQLKAEDIGTYQLFQETYHQPTYEALHRGPKSDYERQLTAHDRARAGGLDDLGIGVLFGLYDWRFEVISLLLHAQYMEKNLGVGPHTISVPRFQGGCGIGFAPKHPVSDADFLKLIAVLRLSVPYTGMILTTRESAELRRRAFHLGISQASAASVTVPGGYFDRLQKGASSTVSAHSGQFKSRDERALDEVVAAVVKDGLLPSFCTACYRSGRTGEAFMELAKDGDIHAFCRPNAILTFAEYLQDFAKGEEKEEGFKIIQKYIALIEEPKLREEAEKRLSRILKGERDLFF